MGESGILPSGRRVELIAGEIIEMSPQGPLHALSVQRCMDKLRTVFGVGFSVRCQLPLALDPDGEPEPDVSVVRGRPEDYRDDHPNTAVLVVEVADSTLKSDRDKAATYARMGIPEYWLVNLVDRVLEVHRGPDGTRYAQVLRIGERGRIAPLAAPQRPVAVSVLLP